MDLETAIAIAVERFRGRKDKDGQPYILHLLRVMLSVPDPAYRIAAVLHDVVEDTTMTMEDLRETGFADRDLEVIDLLTHRPEDSYCDYVLRLSRNPAARACKMADLGDNYRLDRVAYRQSQAAKDSVRIQRYILSYQFLSDKIDEAQYREAMSDLETQ
jgi:hypothetical protein